MEEEAHEFFHTADHFSVDDLLVDFPNDEDEENDLIADSDGADTTTAVADSSNSSSFSNTGFPTFHGDVQDGTSFSGDLCVPSDELAELEWLSNFVEDSFSTEHVQKLQLKPGYKTRPDSKSKPGRKTLKSSSPVFTTDVSVPAKARSKRSRAAACNWASRELPKEAFYDNPFTGETIISSLYLSPPSSPTLTAQLWRKLAVDASRRKKDSSTDSGEDERRCLHCATDKTPQWRTGPMGPKTLCNACGVRYKSGRLVPEYRPVASPTFVLSKHSNSHRKVMQLRRQKEMTKSHHDHHGKDTAMILDVSSDGDDYLIHHNVV